MTMPIASFVSRALNASLPAPAIAMALVLCVLGASTLNALAPRLCQDTFQDGGVRLLVLPGASVSVSSSRKRRELNVKCARELVQRAEQHGG